MSFSQINYLYARETEVSCFQWAVDIYFVIRKKIPSFILGTREITQYRSSVTVLTPQPSLRLCIHSLTNRDYQTSNLENKTLLITQWSLQLRLMWKVTLFSQIASQYLTSTTQVMCFLCHVSNFMSRWCFLYKYQDAIHTQKVSIFTRQIHTFHVKYGKPHAYFCLIRNNSIS